MLIVMQPQAKEEKIQEVIKFIKQKGFDAHVSKGAERTVIGAIGRNVIDKRDIELLDGVKEVIRISSPYKLVSRTFQPEDTIIDVKGTKFGGGHIGMIAGPCTVESYDQMDATAHKLYNSGVRVLRGGAFKPRTSPYAFQGLGEEGLKILKEVADKYNMAITSEVMEVAQIPMFLKYVDILQVGARNMQNFNLLKSLGEIRKPVLLKRGLSATIEEWLMSAEYILAGGNREVIPVVQKISHLPIVVDPSHATGLRDKVAPMSKAAIAAGADGLIIEVHNSPETAICDGAQSLYPEQFDELFKDLKALATVTKKTF
jgi:3-deoxy-7-phosphoheptulonate synthase